MFAACNIKDMSAVFISAHEKTATLSYECVLVTNGVLEFTALTGGSVDCSMLKCVGNRLALQSENGPALMSRSTS